MSITSMSGKTTGAVDKDVQKELQYQNWKKMISGKREEQIARIHSHLIISIAAKAKQGKSGLGMDIRTEEEIEEGQVIRFLDFDDGAEVTWKTCWDSDKNIYVYCPNHINSDGTENYALTMQNALNFIRETADLIEDGVKVRALVIDGMDKWNDCATNKLRYERVKGDRKKMMEPIPPTAYGARNIDHNIVLTSALKIDADKVFITHLKPTFGDHMNPTPTGFVPSWNKDVPDKMNQMLKIIDESIGNKVKYVAKLMSSKTCPNKVGKKWTIFESDGKKAVWHGIPDMRNRDI
tara:strand:- start:2687 stop:3565 length:879 start_codon:yes stop_codon:yes gene_type:complete